MKELDFDELDRAVNSLVGQVGKSAETPKSVPTSASQSPTSDSQTISVNTRPKPTATVAGHRAQRLDVKRPAKPSGKGFIDIMAPKAAKPAPKVSRTSATIQPASKAVEPNTLKAASAPATSEPKKQPTNKETPQTPAPELLRPAAQKPKDEAWPDPLDFHATTEEAKQPQESPFIPGTKVEKRPLGSFTAPPEPAALAPAPEPVTDTPTPADTPEELKPDALVAESTEPAKDELEIEAEPEKPTTPTTQNMHESAMMSIPQQYKTATKEIDESHRPVFDTKEYHPPLLESTAHAAHRGSSVWSKLLVALLVVGVLAVAGYFAFMYFVQNF